MTKTLMLLGGIRYLLPVIDAAHQMGHRVITADYLPDNIAHRYSDEYVNVSIIDREAVLRVAQEKKIDGILSFGVDPGVVTAAYVAEKMGLPFACSYKAATILQNKGFFRDFLRQNGFNCPWAHSYDNAEQGISDAATLTYPVIVKPVDSAGSKGVTRVDTPQMLPQAIATAIESSITDSYIIEQFLDAEGGQSGSECFFVDGKVCFNGVYDQLFDADVTNPYAPTEELFPSQKAPAYQDDLKRQLQKLSDLLGFSSGLFNIEWRIDNGKVYLMEVSPRAGGNRLAEVLIIYIIPLCQVTSSSDWAERAARCCASFANAFTKSLEATTPATASF